MQVFKEHELTKDQTRISFITIDRLLNYLSIGIKPKHLEYIILQLFKLSNNLELLDFNRIFSIFSIEALDYSRSPSPSPVRKTTTSTSINSDDNKSRARSMYKFRTSFDEPADQDKKKLSPNMKYLYFGQGFINDLFKTYYINNLVFKENEEISGNFFYNNETFTISGEFQNSVKTLKFSAVQATNNKKIEFDGLLLNKFSMIQGTLKIGSLEEDLTLIMVNKLWKFEGKFTNNKNTYEFNGFLAFKANNIIEGKGVDALGEYSLKGNMERDLQIKLEKSYKDNTRMKIEGAVQRDVVVGHCYIELEEEEEGDWNMAYQEIL